MTREPGDVWTAQQLREATPFGQAPCFLIRDNDRKYGVQSSKAARGSGIEVLRTAIAAPKANASWERFLGTLRRECLDHVLILDLRHLRRVLHEYILLFNGARPHQGLEGHIPIPSAQQPPGVGRVLALPVLGELHHGYRRAA